MCVWWWGGLGVGRIRLELPALGSVTKCFSTAPVFVTVLFPDSNSCRQRGTTASHVLRVENISMCRLSCRWYCLQRFMQFWFMALYCAVKWKWRRASSTYQMHEMRLRKEEISNGGTDL